MLSEISRILSCKLQEVSVLGTAGSSWSAAIYTLNELRLPSWRCRPGTCPGLGAFYRLTNRGKGQENFTCSEEFVMGFHLWFPAGAVLYQWGRQQDLPISRGVDEKVLGWLWVRYPGAGSLGKIPNIALVPGEGWEGCRVWPSASHWPQPSSGSTRALLWE